jgi:ubiquinol oxidase
MPEVTDSASVAPTGPVSAAVTELPHYGPMERLDHDRLVAEQRASLASPRRRYSLSARLLFAIMDRLYGEARTLEKFRVLELVARVPYQAWENVAYVALTHTASHPGFARRVFDRVRTARWEQDNEQWHLLILEERIANSGKHENRIYYFWIPQAIALVYYHISWLLFVLRPDWSYRLNADFEDHAEHEYMYLVTEHPEWETTPFDSDFAADYGSFASVADLFRQIGHDERFHKEGSIAALASPRFS